MTRKEEIERLDNAIEECKLFQFRPKEHVCLTNPLTRQELLLNTARSKRHFETRGDGAKTGVTPIHKCMYCNFQTTPTLFYVYEDGNIVFPDYDPALHGRNKFKEENTLEEMNDYYKMVEYIAPSNRLEGDWLCRVFLNLTPAIVRNNSKANCFLIAAHPGFHYSEICDLPEFILGAVIEAMKLLADWANENGLVLNPFYNGGKSLASGQSVDCLHFQVYALPEIPQLYGALKERWKHGYCSVCELLKTQSDCLISFEWAFGIYVHPYPEYNFTWLITEKEYCTTSSVGPIEKHFNQVDSRGLAQALKKAVSFYPLLFGTMPAYNILFRLPEYVGHFHVEIIPRTNTNIIAGCELNTKTIVITQDPRDVAVAIKEEAEKKGIKLRG